MKPWKIYKIKGFPMSERAYGYFSFWGWGKESWDLVQFEVRIKLTNNCCMKK